ncbi:hypothetical protein [Sporanaerobacter acetigenes]|uniref:Uncharacterized protein n=1 Tax=Sporanaerobacter acetigenes DSM 13106 TaxID=1123281 RepID=A0A1M5URE0_9FIRM|nr:hypothetical protein [Sporanaerobacter acetigenes]SHH65480.1 hypothetical protein SAMN02745180_00739 [Sporanaerobacter acetigenes DSM 13106]
MDISDILAIFFIFLLPIIIKSIQEKSKIEMAKGTKSNTLSKSDMKKYNTKKKEKKVPLTAEKEKQRKSLFEERRETNENYRYLDSEYELDEVKVQNIDVEKESKEAKEKSQVLGEFTKNDIVKGIVMKEILSEPKCRQNKVY